jgi:predicted cobalt transporter CbtA
LVVLSVVGTAVALALARRGWPRGAAFMTLCAAALYAAMPANPDPVPVPPELLLPFRALALGGLTLFWAVFGAAFAWLVRRAALEADAPSAAVEGRRA